MLGCATKEICIAQSYDFGEEAQVDWYESLRGVCRRSAEGERVLHAQHGQRRSVSLCLFPCDATSVLEAHELAFAWFGGVFARLRYDDLRAAVKKVLRGHRREETERFVVFRSHWGFEAEFCNPEEAHEKRRRRREGGYFRRNHFVPMPQVRDLADLNRHLLDSCREDGPRLIGSRSESTGTLMVRERDCLRPLPQQGMDLTEVSFPTVDSAGCVSVKTNRYSTPLRPGMKAHAELLPAYVEIWSEGQRVARHERCYQRRQQILDLEHYLEPLSRKPGALAGSTALVQWRQQERWKDSHDRLARVECAPW